MRRIIIPLGKKGSLNLSIQAIVIIVIAFVVLGLGLTFVRGMFKKMTETSFSVQEQIEQQILDDLRTGNKKLSFPSTELKMETASSKVIAIGVKNTGDEELNFKIELEDLSDTCQPTGPTTGQAVAVDPSTSSDDFCAAFYWDNSEQGLKPGESKVVAIKYFAPKKIGSYLYKIRITEIKDGAESEYDSRTFFVTTI